MHGSTPQKPQSVGRAFGSFQGQSHSFNNFAALFFNWFLARRSEHLLFSARLRYILGSVPVRFAELMFSYPHKAGAASSFSVPQGGRRGGHCSVASTFALRRSRATKTGIVLRTVNKRPSSGSLEQAKAVSHLNHWSQTLLICAVRLAVGMGSISEKRIFVNSQINRQRTEFLRSVPAKVPRLNRRCHIGPLVSAS